MSVDAHYTKLDYKLTEQDIKKGILRIDPYFVSNQWELGIRDPSGAMFHMLKNMARDKPLNTIDREIRGIHRTIKRLAELHGIDLDKEVIE